MLCLTRHPQESIAIDDDMMLTVLEIDQGLVTFELSDARAVSTHSGRRDDYWRLGSRCKVIILDVKGSVCRFGFIADPSVSIMRTEIVERTKA